jgi:GntR family phosphonate transport system transcriptional regulator
MLDYPLSGQPRFTESLARQRRVPGGRLLAAATVPADAAVAARLELAEATLVQRIASLRTADEVPVAVRTAFFPAARFPNLAEAVARHGAVTPALAEYGVTRFERRETRIGARIAGPRDAKLLNIAESAAVLVTDSVNVDSDGVPIETCQTRYPAERMTLTVPGAPEPD